MTITAIYLAARVGLMPPAGYEVLYTIALEAGQKFGASHERVVLGIYKANCRPYRIPHSIRRLAKEQAPETAGLTLLFTCRTEAPLERARTIVTGSR